jgi:hypothetical protein
MEKTWAWWHMTVIPVRKITVQSGLDKKEDLISKTTRSKWTRGSSGKS